MRRRLITSTAVLLIATVGRTAQAPPAFEVAAIKPSTAGSGPLGIKHTPGELITSDTSIAFLIRWAYDLDEARLVGATSALDAAPFDIVAKIPAGELRPGELKAMMQNLLAERFHLRVHKETRDLPAYTLAVDKDGPRLHFVELGDGPGQNPFHMPGLGHLAGTRVTAEMLAKVLSGQIGHPVRDVTGLERPFDFDLQWSPENEDGPNRLPSIFTALRQQLGLRLVAHKSAVEVIVIDSVNISPSEN